MFANQKIITKIDPVEPKSQSNFFAAICAAAENNNTVELLKLLESGIYINLRDGLNTPISFLAEKGNENAVNMLLHYGAEMSEAVRGFARGGYHTHVTKYVYRESGYAAHALEGYASVCNEEKVTYWSNLYADGRCRSALAFGYAAGKKVAQLEQYLLTRINFVYDAIMGSAYAGDEETLDKLMSKALENHTAKRSALIFSAFGGHDKLVNKYLVDQQDATSAAMGYIRRGDVTRLEEMLHRGADAATVVFYTQKHLQFPSHKYAIPCALRLLATVSDAKIRSELGAAMQVYVGNQIDFDLTGTATTIRERMQQEQVDFAQAWSELKTASRRQYRY